VAQRHPPRNVITSGFWYYKYILEGEYFVDPLINEVLQVELKTIKALDYAHRMQCTNYLKATALQLCLPLNFAKHASSSNAQRMAHEPHRDICVFCVHRLSASALKFFLAL
jgi:GxxExxY protein